ncbi:hypothetical protein BHE74_00033822, partial [Ensete ventricosum]
MSKVSGIWDLIVIKGCRKDELSISLKSRIKTKTSMSPSGESVGSRKEISTNDSSPKVVKDTGNHGVPVTEERH